MINCVLFIGYILYFLHFLETDVSLPCSLLMTGTCVLVGLFSFSTEECHTVQKIFPVSALCDDSCIKAHALSC